MLARTLRTLAAHDVVATICPNCRYRMSVDPETPEGSKYPTYKGDRILVAKFPYDFTDPKRFDVAVFKYPQGANENYIKRVIGLPSETIVIHRGNIYTRNEDGTRTIQRKPPDKIRAIMQTVYDNDYVVPELIAAGLPAQWQPMDLSEATAWQVLDGYKVCRNDGSGQGETWLGYQNRVPTQDDWRDYGQRKTFVSSDGEIPPRLVSDFYAYNAGSSRNAQFAPDPELQGLHWVGDLIVECELTCEPSTKRDNAQVILRLIKGGRSFDCRIDVATGKARLAIGGTELEGTADTAIRPGTSHTISFANVDCELLLWVDGGLVEFSQDATYEPDPNDTPTVEDLTPARIASNGAALEVDHLRILRDVYYIASRVYDQPPGVALSDYLPEAFAGRGIDPHSFLANPSAWPRAFSHMRTVEFPLRSDEFLMMGDNSPRSADSRLWKAPGPNGRPEHYVKRDLLVGRAVFVYWPHSWNRIPGTRIPFPFFPNFARMKFVR